MQKENFYVLRLDEHNYPEELARLILMDHVTTNHIDLLPPSIPLDQVKHIRAILDLGCGSGEWLMRMAACYPNISAVGLELNPLAVEYANTQALVRKLSHCRFLLADALQPLPFPNGHFDLIHLRNAVSWIPPKHYPVLLAECQRVLKPGAILVMSEPENGLSNSDNPATAKFFRWVGQMYVHRGMGFGDGTIIGITPMLRKLVHQAGFQILQLHAYVNETYPGSPYFDTEIQVIRSLFDLMERIVLEMGISSEDYQQTLEEAEREIQQDTFYGMAYMVSVVGIKPE